MTKGYTVTSRVSAYGLPEVIVVGNYHRTNRVLNTPFLRHLGGKDPKRRSRIGQWNVTPKI